MEKVKIEILPEVTDFLNELVEILFYKEYFGFEDTAQFYVQKIYDFIENDLINFPKKSTPKKLKNLGLTMLFIDQTNEQLGIFSLKKAIIVT